MAATYWTRYKIGFDDLIRKSSFKLKHDENLSYALGETWVMALAQTCGERAMGDLLRAMGKEKAPKELEGVLLWQDSLQAIGCDLESVNDKWTRYLADISHKGGGKQLLRMRGGVAGREDDKLILIAYLSQPIKDTHSLFIVRVRDDPNADETQVRSYYGVVRSNTDPMEIKFRVPVSLFIGHRFEYQFGYFFNKEVYPYFEPWQSGEISGRSR